MELNGLKIFFDENFDVKIDETLHGIKGELSPEIYNNLNIVLNTFNSEGSAYLFNMFIGYLFFFKNEQIINKLEIKFDSIDSLVKFQLTAKPNSLYKEAIELQFMNIFTSYNSFKDEFKEICFIVLGILTRDFCEIGCRKLAYVKIKNSFPIHMIKDDRLINTLLVSVN